MNAVRPDGQSAEPILLTEATLEHVLDVFLPEGPDTAAAGGRARTRAGDPTDELFESERPEDDGLTDLPIAVSESSRPWRTYTRSDAETLAVAAPSSARLSTWAVAAGVAIGLVAIGVAAGNAR